MVLLRDKKVDTNTLNRQVESASEEWKTVTSKKRLGKENAPLHCVPVSQRLQASSQLSRAPPSRKAVSKQIPDYFTEKWKKEAASPASVPFPSTWRPLPQNEEKRKEATLRFPQIHRSQAIGLCNKDFPPLIQALSENQGIAPVNLSSRFASLTLQPPPQAPSGFIGVRETNSAHKLYPLPNGKNNSLAKAKSTPSPTTQSSTTSYSSVLRQNIVTPPSNEQRRMFESTPWPFKLAEQNLPPMTTPTMQSLVHLIRTHVSNGEAELAETALRRMVSNYHAGFSQDRPDGGCFNLVLHAYANRGDASKSDALLQLMWNEHANGSAPPDKRIFTTVMYAWSRSTKKAEAPLACEFMLQQMHSLRDRGYEACGPDTFTYTCILHCWANSERHDAPARAERLFRIMLGRYENGEPDLQPDAICFSNLINTFVNNGPDCEGAERIVWEMVDAYIRGNANVDPPVRTFNTVLAAWCNTCSTVSPDRVQGIIQQWRLLHYRGQISAKPDQYSFGLLLKAWSKSGRPDAPSRLSETFEWMKDLAMKGEESAKPNQVQYTTLINALCKAGLQGDATGYLHDMIESFMQTMGRNEVLDTRCFHMVMTLWSRNKNREGGKTNESILRRMWNLCEDHPRNFQSPDATTYKLVILSYCSAKDPAKAEELLYEMEDMIKSGLIMNSQSSVGELYGAVINAWKKCCDFHRFQHIRSLQGRHRTDVFSQK